jgi:phenylalanyl-tRNA synthetase beta chain
LHPGRCAELRLDGVGVGYIGELHPRWVQKYELGTAPVVFEVELSACW